MRMLGCALACAMLMSTTIVASAGTPSGTWMLSNGDLTVKVVSCGAKVCARLAALKVPRDKAGKPKVDKHNPNPSLRKRPLLGIMVLQNMVPNGENSWSGGTIYNADESFKRVG